MTKVDLLCKIIGAGYEQISGSDTQFQKPLEGEEFGLGRLHLIIKDKKLSNIHIDVYDKHICPETKPIHGCIYYSPLINKEFNKIVKY